VYVTGVGEDPDPEELDEPLEPDPPGSMITIAPAYCKE
jgi:hypothetical protein